MPPESDVAGRDRSGPVAGLLLAAGTSSRMGRNKLLLDLDGESVLRRAAREALAAGLAPLVVVLGHEAERAARELADLDCRPVVHLGYEGGITTSVIAGVSALPADAPAVVVLLADMPHVGAAHVLPLVERWRATGAPLVISDYEGVNAPPMLYDRSLFPELQKMTGGGCGRQVVERHRARAGVVAQPAGALADLDLPEDYERYRSARRT